MKKPLLLLVSLVLGLVSLISPTNASAESDIELRIRSQLSDEQLEFYEKFKENGGSIDYLTKKQEVLIHKAEQKSKDVKNYKNALKREYNTTYTLSYSVSDDSGEIYIHQKGYQHKQRTEAIVTTTFYDAKNDQLIRYISSDPINENSLANFGQNVVYDNHANGDGEFSTFDFKWNNNQFMCGVVGIGACISFCWSLKNTYPKVYSETVCSAACSLAFVIGCMSA